MMWCPECKRIAVCKAIPIPASIFRQRSGRLWSKEEHPDLQWFRRGRQCQSCWRWHITAELGEKFIDELCRLRDTLTEIKKDAKRYRSETKRAATSLRKLEKSLGLLQVLKVRS
jgi:hypothetical protein